jgi:hypothetical protein
MIAKLIRVISVGLHVSLFVYPPKQPVLLKVEGVVDDILCSSLN